MKKIKNIFKTIIFAVAFVFGISLFAVNSVATTFAFDANEYVPVSKFSKHQSSQSNDIVISDIISGGSNSKTITLYDDSGDSSNFSYYMSDEAAWGASEYTIDYANDGILHKVKSPTSGHEQNAQFYSVVSISNNMMLAMQGGVVSVGATAYAWSPNCGSINLGWLGNYKDNKDKITAELVVYNADAQTALSSKSNTVTTFEQNEGYHQFSYAASELANSLNNRVLLNFKSSVQGSLGFYAFTSIKIVNPQITFSTTDTVAPTISGFENVSTDWVQSRTVPVTFEDAGAGIYKIEMQTNGGDWVEIANFADGDAPAYTTSYTYDLVVSENNSSYKFRVTDNVGNVNEMTESFVEENIDTVAPSATVTLPESFGSLKIDFSSVVSVSELSQDTFTYVLKDSTENVIASGSLADAVSLDVYTDGTYIIEVSGIDEAGNTFVWTGETTVQRTVVDVDITDVYTYSLDGFKLESSTNIQGDYEIVWNYFEADGVTPTAIVNVGTYVVSYSIDEFEFVGSGSKTISYNAKEVSIGSIKTDYVYGESFEYTLLDQQDVNADIVVYFTINDESASFENVGTYSYEFVAQNTNYALVETKGTATISPLVVTATITDSVATYDKTAKFLNVVLSENLEFVCEYTFGGEVCENPVNAGTYQAVITLKENNPNYSFETVTTNLEIQKATLYVFADEMQTKVYGEADSLFTYTYYGLLDGDQIVGALEREQGEDAGYYELNVGSLSAENYEISFTSAMFAIEQRSLILLALSSEKTYGEADPKFEYNTAVAKILDADKEAFLSQDIFVRTAGENVGRYTISLNESLLSVAPFKNYKILSSSATFVVKKATALVVADNIVTPYGDDAELTYQITGLAFEDTLDLVLLRDSGDYVGDYAIYLANDKFDNYNIDFVSGTYQIVAREIEVVAHDISKKYGDNETLTFDVLNAIDENVVSLSREVGENVGTYTIDNYQLLNSNYVVTNFTPATLVIEKAEISVVVGNALKVYGEADPVFACQVAGLKFDDRIEFELVREVGEDVGEYVISVVDMILDNYVVVDVQDATLVVSKATPTITIDDKSFVYDGNQINYSSESEFELSYTFYFAGTEIEAPINAGEYTVVANFAGNNNFNPATSNEAKIVINKKFIPITLKKLSFLYNGKGQVPEYEIGLDSNVSVLTIFEGVQMPVEVGEYNFTMVSNDPNHYANTTGVLKIVEVLYVQDTQNSASVSSTSVSATNASISILNNKGSELLKQFNPLFDGRKCVAVYEFANAGAKTNGEVFTVRIKAVDTENPVEIFAVSATGEMVKTAYTLVDGYYVFSLNSLSNQIMVTTTNNMMFYARIVAMVSILFMTIIITKSVNRKKLNHFLKRNTTVKRFSKEELRENIGIVNDKVELSDRVSPDSFINVRKTKSKAKNGA